MEQGNQGSEGQATVRRIAAFAAAASVALGGLAAWQMGGRHLWREAWRGIAELITLEPARAVAVVTGLLGG